MESFNINMEHAVLHNIQQGNNNTMKICEQPTTSVSAEEWEKLKRELYYIANQQAESNIAKNTHQLIEKKDQKQLKEFFIKNMPSFVRDVMVNVTSDALLVLCKLLF